ncbi:MAG: hypothetical protein OZ921_09945 [Sorangiineae bacterium]|nr:hypothetical protein [Sorangiineae bacterium]
MIPGHRGSAPSRPTSPSHLQRPLARALFAVALAAVATGCGSGDDGSPANELPACSTVKRAIVTDIDETLTTSDAELVNQLFDGTYDPKMRAGADTLMQGYSKRGYFIFYLTARVATMTLAGTGESMTDATDEWLERHGFPMRSDRTWVALSQENIVGRDPATVEFKTRAIEAKMDEGYRFEFAYGNATTDIDAYENAGIAKADTFIIGKRAGDDGTTAIAEEDYLEHERSQLPAVETICAFR